MPDFYGPPRQRSGNTKRAESDVATDVRSHVATLENRADVRARLLQHDLDERIYRLEKYVLEELATMTTDQRPWPSVTLNGPRTFYNALRRAVTTNDPRFRIQIPSLVSANEEEEPELYKMQMEQQMTETARHERFARGLFREIDEQRVRRSDMPLATSIYHYFAVRGGSYARVWFDDERRYPFSVQLWDPRTVVSEPGLDGLSFACHHYKSPRYKVAEEYPKVSITDLPDDSFGNVDVYDAWWLENGKCYNTVFTGGPVLCPPREMMKQDHLPVFCVRPLGVDVEEAFDTNREQAHTEDAWESIYAVNREVYRELNRIATLFGIFLQRNAIGGYAVSGMGLPPKDQIEEAIRKPFGVISGTNIDIKPIQGPEISNAVKEFFSFLQGEEQRGSVPYSTFGQLSFQLSGFAVNQLQGAVGIMAEPLAKQMGWMYRLIADECLQQFRSRGRGKLTIRGMDQRNRQFIEDIQRSQIREKYYLEVEVAPELPTDRLQEAQTGLAWSQMGIDPITILDELLKVDDPQKILERMTAWNMIKGELAMKTRLAQQQEQMALTGVDPSIQPPAMAGNPNPYPEGAGNQPVLGPGPGPELGGGLGGP